MRLWRCSGASSRAIHQTTKRPPRERRGFPPCRLAAPGGHGNQGSPSPRANDLASIVVDPRAGDRCTLPRSFDGSVLHLAYVLSGSSLVTGDTCAWWFGWVLARPGLKGPGGTSGRLHAARCFTGPAAARAGGGRGWRLKGWGGGGGGGGGGRQA